MSSLGGGAGPSRPIGGGPRGGRGPPLVANPPLPLMWGGGMRDIWPKGGGALYPAPPFPGGPSGRIPLIPGGPPVDAAA